MKIITYAILKDYYGKELQLNQPVANIDALRDWLIDQVPAAAAIIDSARFAVDDVFVDGNFDLSTVTEVHIIPPSSGG